ncbi:MAG: hypothetical protein JSS49_22740 [Planctomycetes bacterium]|nr:hypothetical protein [Planctomycetota bacterium]
MAGSAEIPSTQSRCLSSQIWSLSAVVLLLVTVTTAGADGLISKSNATSGTEVPSFYVRAVTGPLAGKSVCYVCRNGDRPVVIVFLRDLGPDVTALLKDLDRTVDRHRADGLRCFAVLLTETPQRDSARLQTLAFDEKIELPLTVTGDATTQGSTLAFPRDSSVAVVTYQDRRIVERFQFKAGKCNEPARLSIVAASEKLLNEK